jgi:hypothetical protein
VIYAIVETVSEKVRRKLEARFNRKYGESLATDKA